jgi:sulfur-oxidizing protein SoxX
MQKQFTFSLTIVAAILVAGCASGPSSSDLDKITADMVKSSFRDQGIVKVSVLTPDDVNTACVAAEVSGKPIEPDQAAALQATQAKTITWPADGNYLGDWKKGEALAQNGRGLTWTDDAKTANGGNCYNCHQLDPKEISFGTIGPSLTGYGIKRGVVADPSSPASKAIIQYTWGKIWNSRAYNACSVMPRAVHKGIITEAQAKDLMALLLDPASPVNK